MCGCRQYASFQDKYHLYMLFDLMLGGDLMDVLVAEAKVVKRREAQSGWKPGCLAPKARTQALCCTCACAPAALPAAWQKHHAFQY